MSQTQTKVTNSKRPGAAAASVVASSRDKLPAGSKRYGQWAAVIVFVLAVILIAGWVWTQKSGQTDVVAVNQSIAPGTTIQRTDLRSESVSGVPGAIPVADVDSVIGKTTTVGLVSGQVVPSSALTTQPVPGPGQRKIGLLLDSTRTPAGLQPGDVVEVLEAPPTGDPNGSPQTLANPQVLVSSAQVYSASPGDGGATRLALLVPSSSANRVAEYEAAGRVTVVQSPVGQGGAQ